MPNAPTMNCQPFDFELLCAKLEVARLEQDAARSRRRYRPGTGNSDDARAALENDRDPTTIPTLQGRSRIHWTEETKRLSPESKKGVHPKHLFASLNVGKSMNDLARDRSYLDSLRHHRDDQSHSRRTSTGDFDAFRPAAVHPVSDRKSVAIITDVDIESPEEYPRNTASRMSSPKDAMKRRSKTFPLQLNKFTSKQRPMSAYGYINAAASESGQLDSPESPMGLVNEYTISYDLADILRDEQREKARRSTDIRPGTLEKRQSGNGLRSRSLLNLHQLLKKDRTQVQTEEVDIVLADIPEDSRPLTTANGHHHARQKSLPIGFGNNTMAQLKTEEREKKRRSFVGFFKKFS